MEMPELSRAYSDKYVPGQSEYDLFKNKNTDYFNSPVIKLFYVALLISIWGLIHVTQFFATKDIWTVMNMLHGVVSGSNCLTIENMHFI